ncbi:MAG: M28 family peptidase [Flavisolibacter sp.]|nr:M28 family peptidase [Flavisolibacter sp.]
MKNYFLLIAFIANISVFAQNKSNIINVAEVERIITTLASDDMQGRRAGTPSIDKAAGFIEQEFKKAGLQPLNGTSYLQPFTMLRPKQKEVKAELDDVQIDANRVVIITSKNDLKVNEKSGYKQHTINGADGADIQSFFTKARNIVAANENTVVFVDQSLSAHFSRLPNLKRQIFSSSDIIFVLGSFTKEFTIKAEHDFDEIKYANVIGVLPGKSNSKEQVIFSAHYDHMGIGKAVNGDSIYNGANDNASGTTAVILLANHFKALNNNERTLVFVAFTAEEMGMFGSQFFSKQINPQDVVAMVNIEMIGTDSKFGKNSAFITGYERSDLGKILQKNLEGSAFSIHPDPYPDLQLFYRSDNATLARLGVPAHTVSTSKMDVEPHYHKVSDEVSTLDLQNMTEIIKAIAESTKSLINKKDAPSRVSGEM